MLKAQKTGIWSLRTTSRSSSRVNKTWKEGDRTMKGVHGVSHPMSLLSLWDSHQQKIAHSLTWFHVFCSDLQGLARNWHLLQLYGSFIN
jgi:hypothetical protein